MSRNVANMQRQRAAAKKASARRGPPMQMHRAPPPPPPQSSRLASRSHEISRVHSTEIEMSSTIQGNHQPHPHRMAVAVPDDDSSISSLAATDTPASAAAVVSPIRRPKPAITPEEREQMSKDMERLRKRLHYPAWLIIPDSPFSQRWDAAYVVFLLFTALVTPYEVALLDQVYWDGLFVVNRIVDLFFLCDMAVQFCSAFRDDNKKSDARLVVHHPTIVRRYLTTWFVWDLVSLIPYTLIGDLSGAPALGNLGALRFIRLLRLITLVRVVKASGMMRRYERKASLSHAQITLVKFGAAIVIMGHWMACLWCMVAALEEEAGTKETTWLLALGDPEDGVYDKPFNIYSAALYWAVVTITSVGYGDISAKNPREFRISTICVLVSSCLWAYIIGSACGVVANQDVATVTHHQTLDQLNFFLSEHRADFSPKLRGQMREFFHNTAPMRRTEEYHRALITKMSPALQQNVTSMYCRWIQHVPYFSQASSSFIVTLVNNADYVLFIPQERVRTCDELKIVTRGMGSYRGNVLSQGSVWGTDFVLGFSQARMELRRLRDTSYALALTYLEVMSISSANLEYVARSFPNEEAVIEDYSMRLAARTNILRVAEFVRQCGSIDKAFEAFRAVGDHHKPGERMEKAARYHAASKQRRVAAGLEDDDDGSPGASPLGNGWGGVLGDNDHNHGSPIAVAGGGHDFFPSAADSAVSPSEPSENGGGGGGGDESTTAALTAAVQTLDERMGRLEELLSRVARHQLGLPDSAPVLPPRVPDGRSTPQGFAEETPQQNPLELFGSQEREEATRLLEQESTDFT